MEIGAKMGKCPAILFLPHELTYNENICIFKHGVA